MSGMLERVALAIENAEVGCSIYLDRLIDGESTYVLKYNDGSEPLEFEDYESASEHRRGRLHLARARAAIEAMREPTEEVLDIAEYVMESRRSMGLTLYASDIFCSVLNAALAEPQS